MADDGNGRIARIITAPQRECTIISGGLPREKTVCRIEPDDRVGGANVSLKWDTIRPSGSLAFGRLASLAFGRLATLAFGRSATLTFGLAEFLLALLAEFVALVVVEPFAGRLFGTQRP